MLTCLLWWALFSTLIQVRTPWLRNVAAHSGASHAISLIGTIPQTLLPTSLLQAIPPPPSLRLRPSSLGCPSLRWKPSQWVFNRWLWGRLSKCADTHGVSVAIKEVMGHPSLLRTKILRAYKEIRKHPPKQCAQSTTMSLWRQKRDRKIYTLS